ncbi:hypothetical protein GJ496_007476 [Pomphorhynchus laevis]|nr:hypothetical protein GJ496_007476 [Pomphorhynchus laevis]
MEVREIERIDKIGKLLNGTVLGKDTEVCCRDLSLRKRSEIVRKSQSFESVHSSRVWRLMPLEIPNSNTQIVLELKIDFHRFRVSLYLSKICRNFRKFRSCSDCVRPQTITSST